MEFVQKNDNIGHEAHLGGALIGLIISIIIVPTSFLEKLLGNFINNNSMYYFHLSNFD
jgi:membrane associated rhomboid family serine protease